uniref:Putative secreted protein n=1 Tax=Anopheles marajoara TaxID=58244 RepID=A0A2M4C838_9DIPT
MGQQRVTHARGSRRTFVAVCSLSLSLFSARGSDFLFARPSKAKNATAATAICRLSLTPYGPNLCVCNCISPAPPTRRPRPSRLGGKCIRKRAINSRFMLRCIWYSGW